MRVLVVNVRKMRVLAYRFRVGMYMAVFTPDFFRM